MQMQAPKGTRDIVPQESYKWQFIESIARDVCAKHGFLEARTPVFEHTEVFLRGIGDTTDVVQKEMYTFDDKGGRSITLKPEGTAGFARMFAEHGMGSDAQPTKMYYLYCPVFRYEKPQAGRLREHHQFGIEVFGAHKASADAECVAIALELFERVGVKALTVHINSIGCPECRPKYHEAIISFLGENASNLCETCRTRIDKNPLRVLDCKVESCKKIVADAPVMIEHLCGECKDHMAEFEGCLKAMDVEYHIDPFIVRGLDYYTRTVFEIISTHIGAQGTVCGGGRYNGLLKQLGGPDMPGVGFGLGMERLLLVAENQGVEIPEPRRYDIYIATMGEAARLEGFKLAYQLRKQNIKVECDHIGRSLKAQFKYAGKLGVPHVLTIGDSEIEQGIAKLKDMNKSEEQEVRIDAEAIALAMK